MGNDQLFKDVLQAFFREFVELFYPDVAAELDFSRVRFLDKETFTDLPDGARRTADLVAEVYTRSGLPELLLFHTEVEATHRTEFRRRMFEYFAMLWLRYRLPIFPVAIFLSPGVGGITEETFEERLFGREILTFRYNAIGLSDLSADDYLATPNPLGPALSALMRPGGTGKAMRWAISLRAAGASGIDEARQALLMYILEQHLPLNATEQNEFREIVKEPEYMETTRPLTFFERNALAKGIEQGVQEGLLQGQRSALKTVLRVRFGELPVDAVARLDAMMDSEAIDALTARAATAQNLSELGLTDDPA